MRLTPTTNARPLTVACVFVAASLLGGCGRGPASPGSSRGDSSLTPVAATGEWPAATPEEEGLDPATLRELVGRIRSRQYGTIDSLLVARHGRLVLEEYFNGWSASQPHTLQSDTKSVTSLLTGLAVEQGSLRVEDTVLPYFGSYEPVAARDARKEALTVRDLLTMRTGLDWSEAVYSGSPLQRLNDCGCDWLRYVLDWPMREPPGSRWEYNSGGVILLGGLVGMATGQRIDVFAQARLFGPLGVQGASWYQGRPDGLPHTGGGLFLRPRDMAKVGTLMADGGRWQGRQVVSETWIRQSTQRLVRPPWTFGAHAVDYGYLWWILSLADPMNPRPATGDVITASGAQGQWIFAVPSLGLVMVTTATNDDGNWARPVDFFFTHLTAAVRR
jgi:CubicO group peptidase (beta-lactamase class C family)